MLININTPINLNIDNLIDLSKLGKFMENNNLKINKSEIARNLNVDRRTVDKYLKGFQKSKKRNKPSKVSGYYDEIKALLSSDTQIFYFRSVLYQYLCDNYNFNIPRPTFYHYLKTVPEFDAYFSKKKGAKSSLHPVIRYETAPGDQAQIDWKESIPFVLADTGEVIDINVLVLILGHSRFRIYKPALNMTQDTLLHLLTEAFETIGGVPKVLITDNMRTIMDKSRTQYHEGHVNSKFEVFAKDFGFETKPCKAHTPQTKGKVESQMKYLDEIRAYSGKLNLIQLYEKIDEINARVNSSLCQGTGKIPLLEFQKEKDSLRPLPHDSVRNPYKIKTVQAKVNTAGMISVKSNPYSVPPTYIRETVDYQIHDFNLYIYFNTKLIAVHVLSDQKLNYMSEHYEEVLACHRIGNDLDEIREITKKNLELIGGIFTNE